MLTLDALKPSRRWVCWRNERRGDKLTKVPLQPDGRPARVNDGATWADYPTVAAAAPRLISPDGGGAGIVLGPFDHRTLLCGLDLDGCADGAGQIAPWARRALEILDSYAERSPSGTGVKSFFTLPVADLSEAIAAIGIDGDARGRVWRAPNGGDHGPGIEVYFGRRWFAATFDSVGETAELRRVSVEALRRLRALAEGAFDGPQSLPKLPAVNAPARLTRPALGRDTSRSARVFRLARHLRRAGETYETFLSALVADAELAAWYGEKGRHYGDREVRRAWERAAPPPSSAGLPDLVVIEGDLTRTARELRDRLADRHNLFWRGAPVRLVEDPARGGLVAAPLDAHAVVIEAHSVARPVVERPTKTGERVRIPITLPERVARLYLAMGDLNLRPLAAVAATPTLDDEGGIAADEGYDERTGTYRDTALALAVPDRPSRGDAEDALARLRRFVRTWPFADAIRDPDGFVTATSAPGRDETAALAAMLTAVCRPSLDLAPGLCITAPSLSGAGTGKGLLARCIAQVAFGRAPFALAAGHDAAELDKRITAAALTGEPVALLDNLNAKTLRSDTLASLLTERPARLRPLGVSSLTTVDAALFIVVTGNGLALCEDLARRFLVCELDAKTEHPETRAFPNDPVAEARERRAALLSAALTIWRWGRQADLSPGKPVGSFGTWARWCRDPLLALGCPDPADRIADSKAADPTRRALAEAFGAWWEAHRDLPMKARDLDPAVTLALDPQGRGRQFLARKLQTLEGTRLAGFVLTAQRPIGRWGVLTYALRREPAHE